MAEKKNLQAPSGMAGLVRYYEEENSLIKLKPQHVLEICTSLIVLEILFFVLLPI